MKIEFVVAVSALEERLSDLQKRGELSIDDLIVFQDLLAAAGLQHDFSKSFVNERPVGAAILDKEAAR